MRKYYSFAGVNLSVDIPDEYAYTDERVLGPFLQNGCKDPHRFAFELVEELSAPCGNCIVTEEAMLVYADGDMAIRYIGGVRQDWKNAYIRVEHRGKEHFVQLKASQFPQQIGSKTVLNSIAAEHLVAQNGGFVFHSSFVEHRGRGILFTAPSGTGKSTQATLWEQHRNAEVINGDRSVVRVTNGGIVACGIPFAGSSNICKNKTLPLAAIVYLKQAPDNQIRRLRGAEAFRRIWEGCSVNTWDKNDVSAVSDGVQQVVFNVPVFELSCTPDERAVKTLEDALAQECFL